MPSRLGLHLFAVGRRALDDERNILGGLGPHDGSGRDVNVEIIRLHPLYLVERVAGIPREARPPIRNTADARLERARCLAHDCVGFRFET